MASRGRKTQRKRDIGSYVHTGEERLNNPQVGMVTPDTDPDAAPQTYEYDPHLVGRSLRTEIDAELLEAYRGSASLPFEPGEYRRAAVKIVDDRGIESLRILEID